MFFFSIVDVVGILSESSNPQAYWRKLKERLKKEGNETVTNCHALKKKATTTEISREKKPETFIDNRKIARQGGTIAGNTRREIEEKSGRKIVSKLNAKKLKKSKQIKSKDKDE